VNIANTLLPVAWIEASAIIAGSNHLAGSKLAGSKDDSALLLQVPQTGDKQGGPYTVLGNITTSPIYVQVDNHPPVVLDGPWAPLNVIAP
jgi:hypothetical protein